MQRGVHMSSILLKTTITFLVVYAVIDIISGFLTYLFKNSSCKNDVFVFIHVKNQEKTIEYIVRSTIINYLNKYGGRIVPFIVIVDKGSIDQTEDISRKLCKDFEFVYYTTYDKYINFKDYMNSRE